jgi:hypothetical protein
MSRQEFRYFHSVLRVRAHAPRQCAHPAQDEPAIERRGDRATLVLDAADPLKKFIIAFGNDNAAHDVTMPAKIFGRGVHD